MKTKYAGIDYGNGLTNIAPNGMRYGIISEHSILQAWADSSEPEYGPAHCPKCGNQADTPDSFGETFQDGVPEDYTSERYESEDYVCVDCKHFFGSESAFGDEPIGFYFNDRDYSAHSSDLGVFVTRSPYFTRAQFCSPCVPGAGNLDSPCEDGPETLCFGHDWFEGGVAPYLVYSVETRELVQP